MTAIAVSVAIATADRPDALVDGANAPLEEVVIDQGATAATEEVVRGREQVLPCLRLVARERRGLSASRNFGLRETVGAVLVVTDGDCVPDCRWIAAIASAFADDPSLHRPDAAPASRAAWSRAVSSRTSVVGADHRRGVAPLRPGSSAPAETWLCVESGSSVSAAGTSGWDERLGVGSPGRAGEDVALVDRLLTAPAVIPYEPDAVVRHERRLQNLRRATRWMYGHGYGGGVRNPAPRG